MLKTLLIQGRYEVTMSSKKSRIPVPTDVRAEISYMADNVCCYCTVPGRALQLHHIDENPANNDIDNLVLLCLECHNKTQIKGGFGKKASPEEIKKYRNMWYKEMQSVRNTVKEELVKARTNSFETSIILDDCNQDYIYEKNNPKLTGFILSIPSFYISLEKRAQILFDTGYISNIREGIYVKIGGLNDIIRELQSFYPNGHFKNDIEITDIDSLFWEYAYKIAEPEWPNNAGSMIHCFAGEIFIDFLKFKIKQIVTQLLGYEGSYTKITWENFKSDW